MLIGLPRMHKEHGELRDFLPGFVAYLAHHDGVNVILEEGYGAGIGFADDDYVRASPRIKFGSYDDCLAQDVVMVIRCPDHEALKKIRPGALLLSMLHYSTNPHRNHLLMECGVSAVSLDSIVNDRGRRLVENMDAVGWNGMEAAFRELQRTHPRFEDPERPPISVTVLGSGAVAGAATFAATRYGDQDLRARMIGKDIRGVEVLVVDYDLTWDESYMRARLEQTDLLVDATRRRDLTKAVLPNPWIDHLPRHAAILDLAADPYDFTVSPPRVKGIEGIPQGDLAHFVFQVTDPVYDELTRRLDASHRRVALSCYSWPGIHPGQCMEHYGAQLEPIVDVVLSKPAAGWDLSSENHIERALARAEVTRWEHMGNFSR